MEAIISKQEVQIFEDFYEKRAALNNLVLVSENNELIRNEDLYQRFIKDYTQLEQDYQKYWAEISEKYDIYEKEGYCLHLDFKTCKVTLREEE